jgi:preprotein translocase subunit SecA
LSGLFTSRSRHLGFGRFVGLVKDHARGFESLRNNDFGGAVAELRYQLKKEGQTDLLTARSFALIQHASERTIGMKHFDVQLMGGYVMAKGMLAEMETGEGKTLTAALPACTSAFAGLPVHVLTANDYLVERDAGLMRPLYQSLGLTVGTIVEGMDVRQRRAAYACDITYCTGKQLAFDYLRDRLLLRNLPGRLSLTVQKLDQKQNQLSSLLLRGLCVALIDEADFVLIDEARTPLILSQPGDAPEQKEIFVQALSAADDLEPGADFVLRKQERSVELTERGRNRLAGSSEALGGIWTRKRRREELVRQALSARHLFERDKQYLVRDEKVQIIDENTGRVMADRSWEHGLHQMIEVKEGCEVTPQKEPLAKITYQRFFRRYLRLCGMSGTAMEVAGDLRSTYGLEVVRVPTHRPSKRQIKPTRVYASESDKWRSIAESIQEHQQRGRPVLVGTRSVAASEKLSELLNAKSLGHMVLSARQDAHEASVVSQAGQRGRITVATNMAGRGTDIKLGLGVTEIGGLHVIVAERNDSRRVDRQLMGRCARQGDPGSCESILSFEDEITRSRLPPWLVRFLSRFVPRGRTAGALLGYLLTGVPQRATERAHARLRRDLLKMDEHLGNLLAFSGPPE